MNARVKNAEERRQELERIATADPERLEQIFREYFPTATLPMAGSRMVEAIFEHEMGDRADLPGM